jgi:hypothetical protein
MLRQRGEPAADVGVGDEALGQVIGGKHTLNSFCRSIVICPATKSTVRQQKELVLRLAAAHGRLHGFHSAHNGGAGGGHDDDAANAHNGRIAAHNVAAK